MDLSTKLIFLGLGLNAIASLVMLYPYVNAKRNVDDDFIIAMDKKTGDFTQKKHTKDRNRGIIGFALFSFGFAFQMIGLFLLNLQ